MRCYDFGGLFALALILGYVAGKVEPTVTQVVSNLF